MILSFWITFNTYTINFFSPFNNIKISKKIILRKKQDIFDNIFQNIEYHMRELGHGDVSVNKNMKNLNKIFYDILYNVDQDLFV